MNRVVPCLGNQVVFATFKEFELDMELSFPRWFAIGLVCTALALTSCSSSQPEAEQLDSTSGASAVAQTSQPQPQNLPVLEGKATVELVVKGEPIIIEVDGTHAPVTAGNFVDLVKRGVYDGLVFHRVVREPQPFVVQGGDPQSKDPNFPPQQLGTGSFIDPETQEPRYIPLEIQPEGGEQPVYGQTFEEMKISAPPVLNHRRGAVAMARSALPNSASSQFYVTLSDVPFLDGSYAVFGYVQSGMDVIDSIQQGDVIESARVIEGEENLKNSDVEQEVAEEAAE